MTEHFQDPKLTERYLAVQQTVNQYNQAYHAHAKILAVSKTKSADAIKTLFLQGQKEFGENYLQEALPKIATLQELPIVWHYILGISNVTRPKILPHILTGCRH